MALTKVTYSMIKDAAVNVVDYGADPTGLQDSTAAFVAAVAASLNVFVPEGTYTISSPITLQFGQNIYGVNGGQFSAGSRITNNQVGGGIFWMADKAGAPGQVDGPTISNFTLTADYPIKMNPEDGKVLDGAASDIPYIMKPKVDNCSIQARSSGVGIGVSFTKVFDFIIERCNILSFGTNILLQGSDIGRVTTNRILGASNYQILEIGVGSFGSQNWIENNDILAGGPNCVYIKSCARHVRIYNNYIEGYASAGAIDLTNIDCPQYGTNVPVNPLSIICEDNRIDGQADFTDFVYRMGGANTPVSTKLRDPGTSGTSATSAKQLLVVDDYLPLLFNDVKKASYNISVLSKLEYGNFTNLNPLLTSSQGAVITASNLFACNGYNSQNAGYECGYNGTDALVIKPTMVAPRSPLYVYLPTVSATVLHPLTPGVSYNIYITARSPSSETLNAAYLYSSGGGSLTGYALIPSYKTFLIGTINAPAANVSFGAYFSRTTTTDDIFIQSISFVPA